MHCVVRGKGIPSSKGRLVNRACITELVGCIEVALYVPICRPDGDDTIFSSMLFQNWFSWSTVMTVSLSGWSCMIGSLARCLMKHLVYLSIPGGHWYVPFNILSALSFKASGPNSLSKGSFKKGDASANLYFASYSAISAFSISSLSVEIYGPLSLGNSI